MARGKVTFRQGDVTRAVKAVRAAGERVVKVEVDNSGKIVVVTSNGREQSPAVPEPNDFGD